MRTTLRKFSSLVVSDEFLLRHKKEATSFTRQRKLPFAAVLSIVLRKSVKSLQVVLNEWCRGSRETISASALSQARRKFSHTAFIELLEECVVRPTYEEGRCKRFKGHRLLAIDGSTLHLPTNKELIDEYGTMRYMNGRQQVACDSVEAKAAVLYDVLNEIPLAGSIHRARTNDIKAASEHVTILQPGDIVMADRGFCSFKFFAEIRQKNAEFIIRIPDGSYAGYHQLLPTPSTRDVTVEVPRSKQLESEQHHPASMSIRFIRVDLPDGEVEILGTSLLDRNRYPWREFKKLYYKRWRIETFFQAIKSRLAIENFSGRTVEAIKQDFFSTLFVSGLETVLAAEANEELGSKNTIHKQQVNK